MKYGVRIAAFLLAAILCVGIFSGCAKESKTEQYPIEENTIRNAEIYPYIVRTPHATWYLAQADIDLLGEETFFRELNEILAYQEADFVDAIDALQDYLVGDVPCIDIWTDFSGRTEFGKSAYFSAYCMWDMDLIYVYHGFSNVRYDLLHEYVHYLTHRCCSFGLKTDFWSECIAEYVSRFVCFNRMSHSILTEADKETYRQYGLADGNGEPDQKKVYCAYAEWIRSGEAIGMQYLAVNQTGMTLTEQQVRNPEIGALSYIEACCFFDWLVARYGEDCVFSHMTIGPEQFEEVFGKDFNTLFSEWTEENHAWFLENVRLPEGTEE
ncbi:MAG: hypothetical protein IJJ86_06885 [Clostridia bacterium]|nr:hypothetical protein [Clostridia bacterium]